MPQTWEDAEAAWSTPTPEPAPKPRKVKLPNGIRRGQSTVLDSRFPLGGLLQQIVTGESDETMIELVWVHGDLWASIHKPGDRGRDVRVAAPAGVSLGRACVPWALDVAEEHGATVLRVGESTLRALSYDGGRPFAERIAEQLAPVAVEAKLAIGVECESAGTPALPPAAPPRNRDVVAGLLARGEVAKLPRETFAPAITAAVSDGRVHDFNGAAVDGGAVVHVSAEQFSLRALTTEPGAETRRELSSRYVHRHTDSLLASAAGWVSSLIDGAAGGGAAVLLVDWDAIALGGRDERYAIDLDHIARSLNVAVGVLAPPKEAS